LIKLERVLEEAVTGNEDIVRVLLVGPSPQVFSASRQLFEWDDCLCHFAKSHEEVSELLNLWEFDIVLSSHEIPEVGIHQSAALFHGSRASLFHSIPVEQACGWSRVLMHGKECFGTPDLTAGELIYVLDQLVRQIRADFAPPLS
jgi:hypothetical protein